MYQLRLRLSQAIHSIRLTGSLIFFYPSSSRLSFPCPFTTTQRSRLSFSALPLSSCVDLTVDHTHTHTPREFLFVSFFASQPLHNRPLPSLDVNPLLNISLLNSTSPLFLFLFNSFESTTSSMCAMRATSKPSTSTSTFHVNTDADSASSTPIFSYRPPTSSPLHIVPTTNIIPLSSLNMKDTSTSSRHSRNNPLYPKRRPSPYGVTKSRKSQSPLTLSVVAAAAASRRSPRAAKMESVLQRRRELQLAALRREGILLEDEYREEIRYYMYEMEVR